MSRLTNDIDAINQAVSQNILTLLAGILSLVGILVAMFLLNLWLALASVMMVPLLFWFTGAVARYTRKGVSGAAAAYGRTERRDGGGRQRPEGGHGLWAPHVGDRGFQAAQPSRFSKQACMPTTMP